MVKEVGFKPGFADAVAVHAPVVFEYRGLKATLQFMSRGRPPTVTHMRIGFVGQHPIIPGGFVRVVSVPSAGLLVNPSAWTRFEVDDKRIAGGFQCFVSSVAMGRELTAPSRIDAITAIASELGGSPTGITIGGPILQVEKICTEVGKEEQLRVIYRVIDLLDSFIGRPSVLAGEIPAGYRPKIDVAGAACQVCGQKLTHDSVFCEGCFTPHHEDCWSYLGGCSTFGCFRRNYLSELE